MSFFIQDLRQTCRTLFRARGLSLTVLVILALGFGLNAAMFSAAYQLLLRPLPYDQPDRLLAVFETRADGGRAGVARVAPVDVPTAIHLEQQDGLGDLNLMQGFW